MKKSTIKSLSEENKSKQLTRKLQSQWDLDASGKVLNYAGQFRAKYALLKEHKEALV